MRVAIFDVDGTLVAGRSTEKRFIVWMLRHGHIGPRQLLAAAWFVLRWLPKHGRHVFRKNKAWLSGLSEEAVAERVLRFSRELDDTVWIRPALAELRRHQEKGDIVVLLSGSLQPIVDFLSGHLKADYGIGTHCHAVRGRYTSDPPPCHPFYDDKLKLLASICEKYRVGPGEISAYADSRFDIPLLAGVGLPTAVCPDKGLAEWAKANNCRIIEAEQEP